MPAPAPGHSVLLPGPGGTGAVRSASSLHDEHVHTSDALLSAAMSTVLPPSNTPSRRPSAASSTYSYSYSHNHQPALAVDPFHHLALTSILPPSPARSRASSTSVSLSTKLPLLPPPPSIQSGDTRSRNASSSISVARGIPLPESPRMDAAFMDTDAVLKSTLPPSLIIVVDGGSTFKTMPEPWSIPLPQSPASSLASSHQFIQDASLSHSSAEPPVWIRKEPIIHEATIDIAAQLPLPMSRRSSSSHPFSPSSSMPDWTHFAQQLQMPTTSSALAIPSQSVGVDLPLLQFDQAHLVPLPASASVLAPVQLLPLPTSTSLMTAAIGASSSTLQVAQTPPPSTTTSHTFVGSNSFLSSRSPPTPATHIHVLPPTSSSASSGQVEVASSIPLPQSASTLAPVQPHAIALPPSSSRLGDGPEPAASSLHSSTSTHASKSVQPTSTLDPTAVALPASTSTANQARASNSLDGGLDQSGDTSASVTQQNSRKPLLNDQVLVALRLSDPDLLSSPVSEGPGETGPAGAPESLSQSDSKTNTAQLSPLSPSESHLIPTSNVSSASPAPLPKCGSRTRRESCTSSRRLSHLSASTNSLSAPGSGSTTPTDPSTSAHHLYPDRSHSPAASLIEVFDIFFIYASVTSSTPVKYRQDRLLSLLRAKLGPSRLLLADITVPECHKLRVLAMAHVKAKGFKVPPWPVVVLQVRVVDGNGSGASLELKEVVDPTDAVEVAAAWAAGDEDAQGRCERTWIAHEEIEEAMEMGTLDDLLQLESEEADEPETQSRDGDNESDEQSAGERSDLGEEGSESE